MSAHGLRETFTQTSTCSSAKLPLTARNADALPLVDPPCAGAAKGAAPPNVRSKTMLFVQALEIAPDCHFRNAKFLTQLFYRQEATLLDKRHYFLQSIAHATLSMFEVETTTPS